MVRTRKERKTAGPKEVKLAYPDRSAAPSEETLLNLAQDRDLFEQAERQKKKHARDDDEDEALLPPTVERTMDAILYSASLAMLHFTLDVLVQHQYAITIIWPQITIRTLQAFAVFLLLVWVLHPHPSVPAFFPGLPMRFQSPLRQAIFFIASICSGCYLIHISNRYGYIAVMKRSPSLGCIWVWSVIELNLPYAVLSLALTGGFFYQGGYTVKAPY